MSTDNSVEGLRIRKEVMGEEYVEQSLRSVSEFRKPLLELVTEYGWGAVWGRPGLSRGARSLVTIGAMAALGKQGELKSHVRGAIHNGVTPLEIQEALLQIAVYCGAAAASEAFGTVEAALLELEAEG
jgi:4-carboxymuconolactone decarboxylase